MLGLRFGVTFLGRRFGVKSVLERADQLYSWLKDKKKTLIILDDVWASHEFNLEDIGIPFGVDH